MKKLLSVFLCALFIAGAAATASSAIGKYPYKLYDPGLDSKKTAEEVSAGSIYGQRVILNAPFDAVAFCMPTWNKTDSSASVGVFEWKDDFDTTVKQAPKHERHFDTLRDCATNMIKFDEPLPAGEYFLAIYNTESRAGIWRYPMTKSMGYAYMDGAEMPGDLEITVYFTEKTETPVSQCESLIQVDGTMTAPPEYVIPDDDILYTRNAYPDTWVAIDGLGREVASHEQTGEVRKDKYVGLFYWSWHTDRDAEPFNVTEFTEQYPESINDYKFSKWPKSDAMYFWNEPIYGYYKTTDRWVIRRQAELLAAAGVDVIFFDNTNGTMTWRSSYRVIFDVFEQARKDGVMTPKISFLLPFDASSSNIKSQLESIYIDIYRPGKYQDLWFYWNGKPMVMGGSRSLDSSLLDKEIKKFFTFRAGQPTYNTGDGTTKQWGWLSRYPQARYYASSSDVKAGKVEEMSVGVAQNSSPEIICTAMNGKNIFGRSYTHKDGFAHYEEEDHSLYGYNFAEQWEYALEVDPQIVFVTGWNEWVAGRYEEWGGVKNAFPDEFNDEYSRDIEPSKGKLKDHYYYQFVSYVRRFKGTNPIPEPTEQKTIDIKGAVSQWDDVGPYYVAYTGNTGNRNALGYGGNRYTDESGRNDIKGAKLAHDGDNIYVYVECDGDISESSDQSWMNVYLDTVNGGLDGWESFDYVIKDAAADKMSLYKFKGTGYDNEKVAECDYAVSGNVLQIKVSRADIGIADGAFTVNFKVTDNVALDGDILNLYTSGDAAPAGRFKYCYAVKNAGGEAHDTDAATEAQTESGTQTEKTAEQTVTEEIKENNGKTNYVPLIIAISVAATAIVAAVVAVLIKRKNRR